MPTMHSDTTENATHTPGPWEVAEGGISVYTPTHRLIAQTFSRGDAALVAAAPDLLAALKLAQREMRHSPSCADTVERGARGCSCGFVRAYDQIQSAIAKAEGMVAC